MRKNPHNSFTNAGCIGDQVQSYLRVSYNEKVLSAPLTDSRSAYGFFMKIWDLELINLQEQIYILYLNNANQVIS